MNTNTHYTHWDVRPYIRQWSEQIRAHYGTRWNTYRDHPPGYGLDAVSVDHWGKAGRGSPLDEHTGDQVALHIIGMHPVRPVRWLIWWGEMWTPTQGWTPDRSGYSHYDHVHVTYE